MLCASTSLSPFALARADSLLIFGDSLSDSGNAYRLTNGLIPDPTYYSNGRFSDGPFWVYYFTGRQGYYADLLLGRPIDGAAGVWNFAVAGALSGDQQLDPSTSAAPGVLTQVRGYLDDAVISGAPPIPSKPRRP